MKTRANFAFPEKDLKKWKLAATARGTSLTEFMTKSANQYLSAELKQLNAVSDTKLDLIIQTLQKLHDLPAIIQLLNRIFRTTDETGKGIEAMIIVDKDIRQELLSKHPELRSKYQQ
jgi:hypothetical protein